MREYSKKEASLLQEKQVAKLVNGQVQVASGGTPTGGGDVLTDNWFFECKTVTTPKDSYNVKKSIINKMKEQRFEQRKDYCALAFRFSPEDKDYFVIDSDIMQYLLQCQEYYEKSILSI